MSRVSAMKSLISSSIVETSLWEALVKKAFTRRKAVLGGQARADEQHALLAVGDLDAGRRLPRPGSGRARRRRRAARPRPRRSRRPARCFSSGSSTIRLPSARTTMSSPPSCFSAPTSRRPPRTSASPAIRTRLSSTFSAALLIVGSSTIQPSWMRPSPPNRPSIAARASRVSTSSAKPPAAPKARRKNLSLLAEARALSPSRSRQRARISGIVLVGEQFDAVVERADRATAGRGRGASRAGWRIRGISCALSPCRRHGLLLACAEFRRCKGTRAP